MSSTTRRPRAISNLFIPGRDPRHRTACLALYRALLRSTPQIALPRSVLDAWQPLDDPLKHLIRRAFRRNRNDTSPRLLYPALDAGYRALATMHNAALAPSTFPSSLSSDPSPSPSPSPNPDPNPEPDPNPAATPNSTKDEMYRRKEQARGSILRFLAARQLERRRSLVAKETHPPHSRNPPPPSSAPKKETLPLLMRVPSPPASSSSSSSSSFSPDALPYPARLRQQQQDQYQRQYNNPLLGEEYQSPQQEEPPVYTTPHRPVPASELGGSGRRRVPHLELAGDFVFLRKSKPQSPVLSRVLTQKMRTREKRASAVQEMMDEVIPDAELEDAWENSVEDLLRQQQQKGRTGAGGGDMWTSHWNGDVGGRGNNNGVGVGVGGGGGGGGGTDKEERRRKMSEYRMAAKWGLADDEDTYRHSMWWHGVVYLENVLSREREDQVARAAALRDLIIKERELAAKEKDERREARRRYWEENIKPTMDGNEDGPRPGEGRKVSDGGGNGDGSQLGEQGRVDERGSSF